MRDVVTLENTVNGSVGDLQTCGFVKHASMLLQSCVWMGIELLKKLRFMFRLDGTRASRRRDTLFKRPLLHLLEVGPNRDVRNLILTGDLSDGRSPLHTGDNPLP